MANMKSGVGACAWPTANPSATNAVDQKTRIAYDMAPPKLFTLANECDRYVSQNDVRVERAALTAKKSLGPLQRIVRSHGRQWIGSCALGRVNLPHPVGHT